MQNQLFGPVLPVMVKTFDAENKPYWAINWKHARVLGFNLKKEAQEFLTHWEQDPRWMSPSKTFCREMISWEAKRMGERRSRLNAPKLPK
jgi:hypothetical protein